ncbi:PilL N-terminal domain-containing protein [Aromatoleum toluclasticum]|uniref:PFGI-1 class ICE element type IV pilus protein PilL2 n=1 Tax=Aromatoleum toluclasticum TaxID=92003 RepID=UPI003F68E767
MPQQTPELVPVVRQGRYTLVELVPEPAQRDLMQQVVEVAIPPTFEASVGDAMRHVLRRTGYRLCDAADATAMYALPLPAAHLRLGPLVLRDALLTLAGPAWDLSVDDASRLACFKRRAAPTSTSSTAIPTDGVPDAVGVEEAEPREVQP